jgi:hypothetical protein
MGHCSGAGLAAKWAGLAEQSPFFNYSDIFKLTQIEMV